MGTSDTTVGVDLAAQPKETAVCVVAWEAQPARVMLLTADNGDATLLGVIQEHIPSKVAIDAPFGWPVPFVDALVEYQTTGRWSANAVPKLRLRTTDQNVIAATGQQPLSVSSDRIAITAMRCAGLLTQLEDAGHRIGRDGVGLAAEVYPAAALRTWGFDPRGYKGTKPEQTAKRAQLVDDFAGCASSWLSLSEADRVLVQASDHLFDALICAVLARAIASEMTRPIPAEDREHAIAEGWIHLPVAGPLNNPSVQSVAAI